MRRSFFLTAVLMLAGCPTTAANDTGTTPGNDAGNDAATTSTVDAGNDAAATTVADTGVDAHATTTPDANVDAAAPSGCAMDFAVCGAAGVVDHTADATVTIGFGTGFTYDHPCIRIHAGTMVTLPGSSFHPLENASCSPASSPVPTTASMTGGTYTFATAGNYGYECMVHAASGMKGLIIVE